MMIMYHPCLQGLWEVKEAWGLILRIMYEVDKLTTFALISCKGNLILTIKL